MNDIRIKEFNNSYFNEVNEFLKDTANNFPSINNIKRGLLVLRNEMLIGLGAIWINSMHPYRKYIHIYITANERNQGIGLFLFREMERRYQLGELQTFLSSDNLSGVAFVKKCGFTLARKSYTSEVTKEDLKIQKQKQKLESIPLIDLTEAQLDETICLQYEDYVQNHQMINPLNSKISLSEWKKIIFENLSKNYSYVLMDEQQIVAYLFCYEADATSVEVGYTGHRLRTLKDYEVFLSNRMIELFQKYEVVELEVDDCDASANVLRNLFRNQSLVSWNTYVK